MNRLIILRWSAWFRAVPTLYAASNCRCACVPAVAKLTNAGRPVIDFGMCSLCCSGRPSQIRNCEDDYDKAKE